MKKKISLYVISHKKVDKPVKKAGYIYMGVGPNAKGIGCAVSDCVQDNIASKNPTFCELTGQYWIWKNDDSDIVGLVHYRRFFYRPLLSVFRRCFYTKRYIAFVLKRYNAILPKPMQLSDIGFSTVREHYSHEHFEKDIDVIRDIIQERQPDYLEAFDALMAQRAFRLYNMVITTKKIYDEYSAFLFDVLFEAEKRIDISDYDPYQQRIFGFIGERLLNVFFLKHSEYRVKNGSVWFDDGKTAFQDFVSKVARKLKRK